MSSTVFTDQTTIVVAAWLNDINSVAYNILGNGTVIPATVAAARTNLGLGTMATQNANAVAITGGTLTGSVVSGNITGNAANVTGTVVVATGGTGLTTTTAYSPVITGTTATGAFQASLGPGTSGQVLTSAGAAALPTWSAVPNGAPPTRQTVLSGTVDTSGYSAFGGSTGTTTVTATATLVATAANGFASTGSVDRIGQIAAPSWTGLSTNGTMYLYLDIASNGTCTTGSGTLAPTYRWGGADVVTNNQFTFNIQEMVGKVGNGATAAQTYRVYVGEVTVAGAVVTAITWYALQGRYDSGWFAVTTATNYTSNHNVGVLGYVQKYISIADDAAGTNDRLLADAVSGGIGYHERNASPQRNQLVITTEGSNVGYTTAGALTATANAFYRVIVNREF